MAKRKTDSKATKRALVSSITAMLLCCIMLLGTTFAWFTDTASTEGNTIQSGTLDIVLEMQDENGNWVDAEGKVLNFVKANTRYGTEALWEPGCTYELPKIRVRNEGNLTAKILVKLSGNVSGDTKLLEALEFSTNVSDSPNGTFEGDYDMISGTPDGDILMDWSLMAKGVTSPGSGHTDTSPVFTISAHMKEEAGNEYQDLKLDGVSIVVVATQQVYEYDSNGNQYDKDAEYPTE